MCAAQPRCRSGSAVLTPGVATILGSIVAHETMFRLCPAIRQRELGALVRRIGRHRCSASGFCSSRRRLSGCTEPPEAMFTITPHPASCGVDQRSVSAKCPLEARVRAGNLRRGPDAPRRPTLFTNVEFATSPHRGERQLSRPFEIVSQRLTPGRDEGCERRPLRRPRGPAPAARRRAPRPG
jgi:hypothetical protein